MRLKEQTRTIVFVLMRSKDCGTIPGICRKFTESETGKMFQRLATIRHFELQVKNAFSAGLIKCPIYLSLGQESIAAALSVVYTKPAIFAQHRAHDLYLAYDGDQGALADELLHHPTGCAKGMGGSASIHSPRIGMFGHSGLMGDQIPIAVGFALGKNVKTLAVMGDASAEEDYVLGAMGYAAHKKPPVLFVCVDNGLSILTKVETRRNWHMKDIASSLGMKAVEIADDPWLVMHHAQELSQSLPAFMNIHTARAVWHAGAGSDGPPEWDRYALIQKEMVALGFGDRMRALEKEAQVRAESLWKGRLAALQTVTLS